MDSTSRLRVFISYRHNDAANTVGWLYELLLPHFKTVFRDVDRGIALGADFPREIETALVESDVVLAIIGPNWRTVCDDAGTPRLFNPNDWVRSEIETALRRGIPVIPVYIAGAPVLQPHDRCNLPECLHPLIEKQHAIIRDDPDFKADVGALIQRIKEPRKASAIQLRFQVDHKHVPRPRGDRLLDWLSRTPFYQVADEYAYGYNLFNVSSHTILLHEFSMEFNCLKTMGFLASRSDARRQPQFHKGFTHHVEIAPPDVTLTPEQGISLLVDFEFAGPMALVNPLVSHALSLRVSSGALSCSAEHLAVRFNMTLELP